jgi:hypothetical protein
MFIRPEFAHVLKLKYAIEMGVGGMIYVRSFLTSDSGIQAILSVILQQFERP